MDFGFAAIPALVVICYLIGEIWKRCGGVDNLTPVVVGIAGAILGIVGWKTMAAYPAEDLITAVAIGIVSGLASTGVHQVGVQAGKLREETNEHE